MVKHTDRMMAEGSADRGARMVLGPTCVNVVRQGGAIGLRARDSARGHVRFSGGFHAPRRVLEPGRDRHTIFELHKEEWILRAEGAWFRGTLAAGRQANRLGTRPNRRQPPLLKHLHLDIQRGCRDGLLFNNSSFAPTSPASRHCGVPCGAVSLHVESPRQPSPFIPRSIRVGRLDVGTGPGFLGPGSRRLSSSSPPDRRAGGPWPLP